LKRYLIEILYLLGDDRKKIKYLMILFFGMSMLDLAGLGLIVPYISLIINPDFISEGLFGKFVAQIGFLKDQNSIILFFGIGLIILFSIKTTVIIFANYLVTKFSQNQQARLRSTLMKSYQGLSYVDFTQRNSAEYVYNISNLTEQFSNQVVMIGLRMVSDIIVATAIIILLAWNDIHIFLLLVTVFGSFIFGYDFLFGKKLKSYGVFSNNSSTSILKSVHESMEGLKEIRILGKASYFYNQLKKSAKEYGFYQTMTQVLSSSPRYLLELIFITFVVLLATLVVFLDKNLTELVPVLGLYVVAAMRLLPMVNGITNSLTRLRYGRDAVRILHQDLLNLSKLDSDKVLKDTIQNHDRFNLLKLSDVSFRYPGSNLDSLKNISLEINSGDAIGIIGGSGAGKTTLVDLILGLIKPYNGKINYNGMPLESQLKQWFSQVAYLPQQVFLIDDTLKANIALGCNIIDESRVISALMQAKLLNFVEHLSEGIDTKVGERGLRLSGGQRQRVALARAFYHNRDILVMDESTSALDSDTEYEIIQEIQRYKGDRTIIVIAHRLTTLKHCDRIYKLQDGKIINIGSYMDFK